MFFLTKLAIHRLLGEPAETKSNSDPVFKFHARIICSDIFITLADKDRRIIRI